MENILDNAPLVSAFFAWLIAQGIKPFISKLMGDGFNFHQLFSTGGMPSSHTATVVALTTSIGITEGVTSVYFAISIVFSLIVVHDAMNIRWEAGKQAEVINEWSRLLSEIHKDGPFTPENLKTMLGHSFSQVIGGFIFGFVISIIITYMIQPW